MNIDRRRVALLRCGAGHFQFGSPLGHRPELLKDPRWLVDTASRLINEGYERIVISRPAGRYPSTVMHGADWHSCLPEIMDAVMEAIGIIPSPGIYTGSAFYQDDKGVHLPYSMGLIGDIIPIPNEEHYNAAHLPWIEAGVKELWIDAASYAGRRNEFLDRRRNFVRWAATVAAKHDVRVVGEAWPLQWVDVDGDGVDDLRIDPSITAVPWFCTTRFIQPGGKKAPRRIPLDPGGFLSSSERYVGVIGDTDITEDEIERAGCIVVKYI